MSLKRIIIDIEDQAVFDHNGHDLGRTGDTKVEIDHDKAMIYMTVNLIMPAAKFRAAIDSINNPKTYERAIKV